jgi:hypothetical protein
MGIWPVPGPESVVQPLASGVELFSGILNRLVGDNLSLPSEICQFYSVAA